MWREEDESGFTLIELLVVIIIIGILAAIAIPVFLSQRSKSYDAEAKSDLRNVATAEESFLVNNQYYAAIPSAIALLTSEEGFVGSHDVSMVLGANSNNDYCAIADQSDSASHNKWFLYDSAAGGFNAQGFASQAAAEGACTDTVIGHPWFTVEGAGT